MALVHASLGPCTQHTNPASRSMPSPISTQSRDKPGPVGRAQPPTLLPTDPGLCPSLAVLPHSLSLPFPRWGFTLTLDKQQL